MNRWEKILTVFITCSCTIFSTCTSKDNSVSPDLNTPPAISWISQGLDSCMVLSMIFMPKGIFLAGTNYGLYKSSNHGQNW